MLCSKISQLSSVLYAIVDDEPSQCTFYALSLVAYHSKNKIESKKTPRNPANSLLHCITCQSCCLPFCYMQCYRKIDKNMNIFVFNQPIFIKHYTLAAPRMHAVQFQKQKENTTLHFLPHTDLNQKKVPLL